MNYYLIDDTPGNIRQIKESIKRLGNGNTFHWIDENGISRGINERIPADALEFEELPKKEFKSNIINYIGNDNLFLIDLSLSKTDDESVRKKYTRKEDNANFSASIASQIIRVLKTHDQSAKIKVISRIWGIYPEDSIWKEPLSSIANEPWFNTISFIPTEYVFEAHESEECLEYLNKHI